MDKLWDRDSARCYVLATGNRHKRQQIVSALGGRLQICHSRHTVDVDETADTTEGNALLKATAAAKVENRPALADDTAFEITALQGGPGIRTARFARECGSYARAMDQILRQMNTSPDTVRTARFRCSAVCVDPSGWIEMVTVTLEGTIVQEPRGDGGFGFDPIFEPDGHGRTLAEMTASEIELISHRSRAFRELAHLVTRHGDPT
jgi:XTP/dITP diphosphohydrolase